MGEFMEMLNFNCFCVLIYRHHPIPVQTTSQFFKEEFSRKRNLLSPSFSMNFKHLRCSFRWSELSQFQSMYTCISHHQKKAFLPRSRLAGSNEVNSKIFTKYLVTTAQSLFSYQISRNEQIVLLAERENGWIYSHLGGMLTGLCTMPDSRSLT